MTVATIPKLRGVVFKSYKLGGWADQGRGGTVLVSYASLIEEADLRDDAVLSAAPGIFQELAPKKFEVRTTIFGSSVFSVAIHPTVSRRGKIDWRVHPPQSLALREFQLPSIIEDRLRAFMHRSDMAFCTFDLICTLDHEFVFLEANQMGQFLWKEEKYPELPLLDAMCRFLASGDRNFRLRANGSPLKYSDYIATGRHEALVCREAKARPA